MSSCAITASFAGPDGSALESAFYRVTLWPLPSSDSAHRLVVQDGAHVALSVVDGFTNASGEATFTVPRSQRFRIEVPAVGMDHVGTAPDAATAALTDVTLVATAVVSAQDRSPAIRSDGTYPWPSFWGPV